MSFGSQGRGFNNPILAGGGALVRQVEKSANYNPGIDGWAIFRDGTAEFNNLTVRGTLIVQNNTQGIFVYSGIPAAGNLISSISAAAGTDKYGNSYPAGFSATQGIFSGSLAASSISASSIGSAALTGCDYQGGTMEETNITFDSGGGQILVYATTSVVTAFTSGSGNFTVPAGITSLKVECWGSGGGAAGGGLAGGANSGGYGGGGGAYARVNALAVTPGAILPYVVAPIGAGGAPNNLGSNGSSSTFNGTSCVAVGGKRSSGASAQGGQASACTGDVAFSGGNAGTATGSGGSGGASSAGTSAAGHNSSNNTGSGGTSGGSAVSGGGAGGSGGATGVNGNGGSNPGGGGGGGGGGASAGIGGNGATGKVAITYISAQTLIASISPVAGTDAMSNQFPAGLMGRIIGVQPLSNPQVPSTWQSPAYASTWIGSTVFNSTLTGLQTLRFRIDAEDNVWMQGCFRAGATLTNPIFALPVGFRPAISQLVNAMQAPSAGGATTAGTLFVSSGGNVSIFGGNSNLTIVNGDNYFVNAKFPLGNIT